MSKTMVYMGPSIRNVILHGVTLKGGYTPALEKELEKQPYIRDLLIPADELAEARKELKKNGSRLEVLYRKIEKGVDEHGI